MPVVEPTGTRVLVTGANGYIGMWVVRTLLEQGYAVRAVVRSLDKGRHLKAYFGVYGDKLELFPVEDITKDGAFDEAVKGVDAIEHTASPATFVLEDPEAYIKPAVQGTVGILESARKFGDKVKRIVITSSVAAIGKTGTGPTVILDERNWNDEAVQEVNEKGKAANPVAKYSASKTLAEKAAWEFYEKHKKEVRWDLVVINPPWVWGPPLLEAKTPEDMNISSIIFWNMMTKEKPQEELDETINFIHVQDIGAAHVAALRKEKAGGERIIVSTGASTWQGARDIFYALRPQLYTSGILPRGNADSDKTPFYIYDAEKGKKILGLQYASFEKIVEDFLRDFEARGWFSKAVQA